MIIFSKSRPRLERFGVASDAKKYYRVVNIGRCKWTVVSKKGEPGTMRQTVRQRSGKIMRESGVGRKTVAIRGRLVARILKTQDSEFRKYVERRRDNIPETCSTISLKDALDEFSNL